MANHNLSLQHQRLKVFRGTYSQFLHEEQIAAEAEKEAFQELKEKRKQLAMEIQQEETRRARIAAASQKRYDNDPLVRNSKRGRAERTMGRSHVKGRYEEKEEVIEVYRERRQPRVPVPRFHFAANLGAQGFLEIVNGAIGFGSSWLQQAIHLTVHPGERLALLGQNGSGKTTLMRALLGDSAIRRSGDWRVPSPERIGYLISIIICSIGSSRWMKISSKCDPIGV